MNTKLSLVAAAVLALGVQGCTTEQVVDNTLETGAFVGRTVVKGAVGAGKLAYRGGKAAVAKARASQAERGDFPPGTAVCQNAAGGYYKALETEDGALTCLPKQPAT